RWDITGELCGDVPEVDRRRHPENVDPAEGIGSIGAAATDHAAVDAAAVLDIALDCVEHHRVEQHAGDLCDRRWGGPVPPRRLGGSRSLHADGDDALSAEVDGRTERCGVADRTVAEIAT